MTSAHAIYRFLIDFDLCRSVKQKCHLPSLRLPNASLARSLAHVAMQKEERKKNRKTNVGGYL
jgi:hypothetical protein